MKLQKKDSKSEVKSSRQMRLPKLIIFFNLVITCKQSRILAVQVLWSARSITIHRTVFSSLPHRGFFVSQRNWEKEKKRKCAGHNGKGKGRRKAPAFSLFPSSPSRFLFIDYCYFYWDTQRKPLRRKEVFLYIIDTSR